MEKNNKEAIGRMVLDTYFQTRRPRPEEGFTQHNRTTRDIQDDLEPMIRLDGETIIDYMLEHGYGTITSGDGTVAWGVWRTV